MYMNISVVNRKPLGTSKALHSSYCANLLNLVMQTPMPNVLLKGLGEINDNGIGPIFTKGI